MTDRVTEITASRATVTIGWDDVPHLDAGTKRELLDSTPPHLREARSKGIPSMGSGAIYPVPLSDVLVDPFEIPSWWPRAYALDVGWRRTAALWATWDREAAVWYLYSEHYRAEAEPSVHAGAVRARGAWIPGVIDPAARGRGQADGSVLYEMYRDLGLDVIPGDSRDVESGLYDVWRDLSIGRLKVFRTLQNWTWEYRVYRRDEKGKVVKTNDHLMDCMRLLRRNGGRIAKVRPVSGSSRPGGARVADSLGGY